MNQFKRNADGRYKLTAFVSSSGSPVDLFDPEKEKSKMVLAGDSYAPMLRGVFDDIDYRLSVASDTYKISKYIKDYVLVPVVVMPSDLTNRNKVAFPYI